MPLGSSRESIFITKSSACPSDMLFQAQIRERPRKRGIRAVCLQVRYTQSCVFQKLLRGGQVFLALQAGRVSFHVYIFSSKVIEQICRTLQLAGVLGDNMLEELNRQSGQHLKDIHEDGGGNSCRSTLKLKARNMSTSRAQISATAGSFQFWPRLQLWN